MYDLYVLESSPYCTKAAAMLRYKGVPFRLRHENLVSRYAVLRRRTGHTRVPVLATDAFALQDSTRIARYLEEEHPDPPLHDPDPRRASLGRLVEQLADEWLVRVMLLVRWSDPEATTRNARLIATSLVGGMPVLTGAAARLVPALVRRGFAAGGVREENRPALLRFLADLCAALEPVLASSTFLFGARPTLADFGLYGPFWQMRADPAGRALLPAEGSAFARWMRDMDVVAAGEGIPPDGRRIEDLTAYAPLLRLYAENWLRFAVATAAALRTGGREVCVHVPGGTFRARGGRYVEGCLKDDLAAIEGALTRAGDVLGDAAAEAPLWVELEALAAGAAREVLRPFGRLWARLVESSRRA